MPKVSVIVPNYNHARFLPERLESVLGQTRKPDEVILLDDASGDNSREILREYAERYPDLITCHFNKENSGSPFIQWAKGLELAHGEFIWIAESDDVADPGFLETLVPMLDADPKVGIAYCQSYEIDADGKNLGDRHYWTDVLDAERWKSAYTNDGRDECVRYLSWRNTIPNASGVLFRKDAYCHVTDMPQTFKLSGDWLVWLSLLKKHDISYTPRILNFFRVHGGTVRKATREEKARSESWCVRQYILDDIASSTADKSVILSQQLNVIGQSVSALGSSPQPHLVIEDYDQRLSELFAELSERQRREYTKNKNAYLPLAKRLADYGNKFYTTENYKLARQYYTASLNYDPYSWRVIVHVASTYFPVLRKLANKFAG